MTDLEAELSAALRPPVDLRQPPYVLDLDRARVHGRRLRRRRQGFQVGAAVSATVAAALLITVPLSGHDGGATVPPASPGVPTDGPSANDPLSTGVTFGWLPSGFHVTGGMTEGTQNDDLVAGNGKTTLFVTMQPAAKMFDNTTTGNIGNRHCVFLPLSQSGTAGTGVLHASCGPSTSTSAPASGLQDMNWVVAPGTPGQQYAELQWNTADGRLASIFAGPGNESADQLRAIMVRVAENVRLGADHALPMPFQLAKPPAGLEPAFVYGSQGADGTPPGEAANGDPIGMGPAPGVAAGLEYGGIDATLGNLPGLALTVQEAVPDASFPTEFETQLNATPAKPAEIQSTTVDGHTARIVTKGDYQALVVHGVNGFDVRLSVGGAQAQTDINTAGGIVAYYHTITFYSTDPSTWTVNVFAK